MIKKDIDMSDIDWSAMNYEAKQLFSPYAPINMNELFAGRGELIAKMIDSLMERGKHVVLFGERGVGKTSLSKLFSQFFPSTLKQIVFIREQADPTDNFTSLWRKVFKDINVQLLREGKTVEGNIAEFYQNVEEIFPDDVRRELEFYFKPNMMPIIVFDEYDKLEDSKVHQLMANTLKSLSDNSVNVTIILVGVAENVNELIGEHESVIRCIEQVDMPRMNQNERKEILDKIIPKLGMKIKDDAMWKIVFLSRGLPAYVHSLGLYATESAISRRTRVVDEIDVDTAIKRVISRSGESIEHEYAKATHSNQSDNLYRQVLLACALAEADDRGSFTPLSVVKPLTSITQREEEMPFSSFQSHLKKFITDERGQVLIRRGKERAYRFRFRDPLMQPYVIMKGIEQGLIDKKALGILSFPAQHKFNF